jgi:hypothetical protein
MGPIICVHLLCIYFLIHLNLSILSMQISGFKKYTCSNNIELILKTSYLHVQDIEVLLYLDLTLNFS